MKIVRFENEQGVVGWGARQPDGKILRIVGDLYGSYSATTEPVVVRKLLSPVEPRQILCIGLNYRKHAEETNSPLPEHPVLFMKSVAAVQHPGEPILLPTRLASHKVDYECELAVVIGRDAKNVSKEKALEYVLGYTCANDVSARDWQKWGGGGQWCRGKSFDTFCPLGPCLVTTDEIPNPNDLAIRTEINGDVLQDWRTNDMIFDVASIIEFLSGSTTLPAGTVILTGTPHGVGMGRDPHRWLVEGEVVKVSIQGIGELVNPVRKE